VTEEYVATMNASYRIKDERIRIKIKVPVIVPVNVKVLSI